MSQTRTFTLPSGKTATIRPGKGRDLLTAQRVANSPEEVNFALMANLVTIDGQQHVMEDYFEMDLLDIVEIQSEMGKKSSSQAPSTSSTSPTTPDGASENLEN
jgi:hypothetical protein